MGRWAPGTKVGDHTIVGQLGSGGMCEVYEAWHERLQATHAIKCLNSAYLSHTVARQKFELEAAALWRISKACDHVVEVYNATGTDDPYIVMELLQGEDLQRWGERRDRGMRPADAVAVVEQTALALEAAHANRTVHRDIKPANIFLEQAKQGQFVKVIDFGIAKALDDGAGSSLQAGTRNYMAPEQRYGRAVPQSDIYALGLIGFFVLTASDFWETGDCRVEQSELSPLARAQELHERGKLECSSPQQVLPPNFEQWFKRCTEERSGDRFGSAKQAAAEFRALFPAESLARHQQNPGTLLDSPVDAPPSGAGKRPHDSTGTDAPVVNPKPTPAVRRLAIPAALLSMALAGGLGVLLFGAPPGAGGTPAPARLPEEPAGQSPPGDLSLAPNPKTLDHSAPNSESEAAPREQPKAPVEPEPPPTSPHEPPKPEGPERPLGGPQPKPAAPSANPAPQALSPSPTGRPLPVGQEAGRAAAPKPSKAPGKAVASPPTRATPRVGTAPGDAEAAAAAAQKRPLTVLDIAEIDRHKKAIEAEKSKRAKTGTIDILELERLREK